MTDKTHPALEMLLKEIPELKDAEQDMVLKSIEAFKQPRAWIHVDYVTVDDSYVYSKNVRIDFDESRTVNANVTLNVMRRSEDRIRGIDQGVTNVSLFTKT